MDTLLARDAHRPNAQSLMVIRTLGGAVDRVEADESAYPHRGARYNLSIDAAWTDPASDSTALAWARTSWDALAPFGTGGVYVNFAGLDTETDRRSVFGRSAQRLDEICAAYDPEGVFAAAGRRP
ncbi:MAG: BBE domain-containing protein [Actinomycetia bacterium]|nr:BBE domain-containing protein [Actinomycetes bacterium]